MQPDRRIVPEWWPADPIPRRYNRVIVTMPLAGLQKTSLIDYPGRIGCVAFLTGCNFRCPFCHNPDLAVGLYPERISMQTLLTFLNQRRQWLEGVVITGGEPTLSPHLPELCHAIRDFGLSIKLDTNGSRPEYLSALIRQGLVDYVAMDIKTTPGQYVGLTADPGIEPLIRRSIRVIMNEAPEYEFRTTCVQPYIDEAVIVEVGSLIRGASLYVLQTYRGGKSLDPQFDPSASKGYSPAQMSRLQNLVSPWVGRCRVR